MKSSVLIIYTGGTIGMVENPATGTLEAFNFEHLNQQVPELNQFKIDLEVRSLKIPLDSSDIGPNIWVDLIEIIEENYKKFDGFVVLHGSDTMAYTASALSFMLENVNKPIIFTGSQLPIGTIRTDGKENLITAIEIAAAKQNGEAIVPEVAIYFEYALYRACRTTKVSAENFEAFQSPNYPLLAEAGVHIKYNKHAIRKGSKQDLIVRKKINTNVASVKIFPGMEHRVFQAIANIDGLEALIIETFGSGNAPQLKWLQAEIKALLNKDVIVVNITQCVTGSVLQTKYASGKHLENVGVLSGFDITYEAAIAKLMYLLSCSELSTEERKSYFQKSLRGELEVKS